MERKYKANLDELCNAARLVYDGRWEGNLSTLQTVALIALVERLEALVEEVAQRKLGIE